MPRRDVPGRVHVGVERETAGHAGEEGLALAALRCDVPARRAALARERGINLLDPTRGFIFQAMHQQTPAGPQDLAVQPGLLSGPSCRGLHGSLSRTGHVADLQVLDPDHVETSRQIRCWPSRPSPCARQFHGPSGGRWPPSHGCGGPIRAWPAPTYAEDAGACVPASASVAAREQFARRQCRTDGYATVDSDDRAGTRRWNRLRNDGECDVPAARPVPGDPVGLRLRGRRGTSGTAPIPPSAPRSGRSCGSALHMPGLTPRSGIPRPDPPCATSAYGGLPGEEVRHRLIEVPQRLLLDHLTARASHACSVRASVSWRHCSG